MPKGKVKEVIDGDTVKLPYNKFVRLEGVDAPEMGQKSGAAAKYELEKLVEDKTISYTEDARSYGRIVGTVKAGSKNINDAMKSFLKKQK